MADEGKSVKNRKNEPTQPYILKIAAKVGVDGGNGKKKKDAIKKILPEIHSFIKIETVQQFRRF